MCRAECRQLRPSQPLCRFVFVRLFPEYVLVGLPWANPQEAELTKHVVHSRSGEEKREQLAASIRETVVDTVGEQG